jgi:hypothetical protein
MNFKRKGPKSTRSGCMLCKPHKRQGNRRLVKVKGTPVRRDLRNPIPADCDYRIDGSPD